MLWVFFELIVSDLHEFYGYKGFFVFFIFLNLVGVQFNELWFKNNAKIMQTISKPTIQIRKAKNQVCDGSNFIER